MYLYLFWLFPALIFLLFFMSDRRRLFNAYLFSINLGLLLLISAFLLVVRTELWFNQQIAIIVFVVISIFVFLSIIFSSIFLLFNGRQMMLLKEKGWPTSSLCFMDCLLSELWHYIFYPISQGMTSSFI